MANQLCFTPASQREKSGRFLKKAAQKLFLCWAAGVVGDKPMAQIHKVFLLLFVHKKKPSLPKVIS
jgi:hypothetical protein